ncbi:LOW QUALITY PROTEIN: hypothetical protein PanWU01x14_195440 [Parasponia andersonii]|uniref:Uncharacterized protein n=1 Tax=Parasponia andersonii TaxID=3476 RepID=A0A2P5C0D7_PARAD|nr:LOW QUALITY PROTEIN: hypothetical protein PanWU01x14_195440 [Parasponia andersonii]
MCLISVVLIRHENDAFNTGTRVIFRLRELTQNPFVYYTCYTCQYKIDIKIK